MSTWAQSQKGVNCPELCAKWSWNPTQFFSSLYFLLTSPPYFSNLNHLLSRLLGIPHRYGSPIKPRGAHHSAALLS